MPGNIIITEPTLVMPMALMAAFTEEIERRALIDEGYAQGESTRRPLTLLARRRFRIARRLTPAQRSELVAFYNLTREGVPFWFYNLAETQPPGSWDETGANPIGRYVVVWDGPLVQAARMGRSSSEFALREVVEP